MSVMELLTTRRTYRRFLQKEVPDEVMEKILSAARLASSAANRQPLKYLVFRSAVMREKVFPLTHWAGYLPPEKGVPKEGERPMLYIAVIIDREISAENAAMTDAGLAISNMTLAAWEEGVGSCIIGALDREALTELCSLPQNLSIHSVVAFGYPSHQSVVEDMTDSVRYYLDENGDYHVPKRPLEEIVRYR